MLRQISPELVTFSGLRVSSVPLDSINSAKFKIKPYPKLRIWSYHTSSSSLDVVVRRRGGINLVKKYLKRHVLGKVMKRGRRARLTHLDLGYNSYDSQFEMSAET